jgi:outer membrane protein assembly factor BamB
MKPASILFATGVISFLACAHASAQPADSAQFWPQWRGPLLTGAAPHADPPLEWSETKNVKWKVKIPGFGTSTPIVWGDRVFIVTAIPAAKKTEATPATASASATARDTDETRPRGEEVRRGDAPPGRSEGSEGRRGRSAPGGPPGGGMRSETPDESYQFTVLCIDRKTGKTLWQKIAREQIPHEGHHRDHGFASASPVTDGKHVLAYFGSRGLYCYDLDGNLKWEKDFGDMRTRNAFGEGSSPALHGNTVVVLWDHDGDDDFIVALDKSTGRELWRTPREELTTWSTPLIVEHAGKTQVVVAAANNVRGYDLASGKQIWEGPGLTQNVVPTPVHAGGVVYATSGFRGSALHAIQLGRTGDLTGSDAIRWSHNRNTPYVPSPLLVDNLLYFVSVNMSMLTCVDARTGEPHFDAERLTLPGGIYASPVSAKDRVYVLGREGTCLVLKKGPNLETLASNRLDDRTDASIALVGKELFIRGHQYLYCIAEK